MTSDQSFHSFAVRRSALLAGQMQIDPDNGPWFQPLDRLRAAAEGRGATLLSFANYDYLGLADHPDVLAAAHGALDEHGVGALGSRLVGGQRQLHDDFEREMAAFVGTERCLSLVSGYLTNVTLISTIMGKLDLIVYDELSHNSIVAGAQACRTDRKLFRHNDLSDLRAILSEHRSAYRNCLIVSESLFSMDGDIVDLPQLLEIKEEFGCWLMLDEAHSIGVLGRTGRGISEHFGTDPRRIDIIVGTLSKSFAACGGFICVTAVVQDLMRFTLPGFVFSVGMAPVITAAARSALGVLEREPERVARLTENSGRFVAGAQAAGLSTGVASGHAIVPVHFSHPRFTIEASAYLLENGIYAPPIISVGVPKDQPRIRFFISARHSRSDIDRTIDILAAYFAATPEARVGLQPAPTVEAITI